jgi:hypothetical protein
MLSAQHRGRLFEDKVEETLTPQAIGRLFDDKVNEALNSYLRYFDFILKEKEVKSKYGVNNSGIDHLISINNYIFCIQCKLENTPSPIGKVNHFLMCINNIAKEHPEKKCIGIYLSKLPVSGPSEIALSTNDIDSINIHNNGSDDINSLIEKLLVFFHYVFRIYSYEYDESIIMRYCDLWN